MNLQNKNHYDLEFTMNSRNMEKKIQVQII